MKSRKLSLVAILALVGCLTACGGSKAYEAPSDAKYVAGLNVKNTYHAYLSMAVDTLNYIYTASESNWNHIFNFVDPLLTTDEFGTEILDLATSASHNDDYTEFTFEIKQDVPWVTYKGKQWKAKNGELQYVSAQDWVTTAHEILTYGNRSSTYYLLTMFVEGAAEYYAYTYISYRIATGNNYEEATDTATLGGVPFQGITTSDEVLVDAINFCVEYLIEGRPGEATMANIDQVKSGDIVGVKATPATTGNGGGTLTYTIRESADYFPSILVYAPGLPTNAAFIESLGGADNETFGTDKDTILYCGPYLLKKSDTNGCTYEANPLYKGADVDKVHLDKVVYTVIPSSTGDDYYRVQFEQGNCDSATLRSQDSAGWETYIEGPDGTGTIEDPYDPSVYSYYRESIGTLIDACVNMDRVDQDCMETYVSYLTEDDIVNTSQALSLVEVRQAILDSLDVDTFMMSRSSIPELREQYAKHAYTPSGLASANGKDYSEFYNEAVRSHLLANSDIEESVTQEEVDAQLANGTWGDTSFANEKIALNHTPEYVATSAEAAKKAIAAYNAELDKDSGDGGLIKGTDVLNPSWADEEENTIYRSEITTPVKVEYASMYFDETTQAYDAATILEMNMTLNGLTEEAAKAYDPATGSFGNGVSATDPWIWICQMDTGISDTNDWYNNVCYSCCYDCGVLWGWGADYADPKTYLNTYAAGGDWADIYFWLGEDVTSFKSNNNGDGLEYLNNVDTSTVSGYTYVPANPTGTMAKYTQLYIDANTEITDKTKRFELYAEAEYNLVNEVAIMKPIYNDGNGWSITLNKTVSYEMPQASYGATDDRLVGLWVLDEIPTNAQRHEWLEQFYAERDAAKAAYPDGYNIYGK
ncbi:MAG: hypothetical protein LUC31_01475 [Coprobacillus sp.]|nr:hypothetical protein [Coprobacillus sp.]